MLAMADVLPALPTRRPLVRAGLQSAIETLRNGGGDDPVKAAFKIARFLEDAAQSRIDALQTDIARMPASEFGLISNALNAAANIHLCLAEFAFPKLARIDVAGEAPPVPQHKLVFKLNIPRPQANIGPIEHIADPLSDGDDPEQPPLCPGGDFLSRDRR
jgi:hypothetical protein